MALNKRKMHNTWDWRCKINKLIFPGLAVRLSSHFHLFSYHRHFFAFLWGNCVGALTCSPKTTDLLGTKVILMRPLRSFAKQCQQTQLAWALVSHVMSSGFSHLNASI